MEIVWPCTVSGRPTRAYEEIGIWSKTYHVLPRSRNIARTITIIASALVTDCPNKNRRDMTPFFKMRLHRVSVPISCRIIN